MPETMKLFGNIKNKIAKNENGKNAPNMEIIEAVLIHCNIADKLFDQLLDISSKKYIYIFKNISKCSKTFVIQNFCISKYGLLIL